MLFIVSSDSGGPLTVVGSDGKPILVGVDSFASKAGCELGFVSFPNQFSSFYLKSFSLQPIGFTRVTSFIPWIELITGITFSVPPPTTLPPTTLPPTTPTPKYLCPLISGVFRDPANCAKFYVCALNIPTSVTCPLGSKFNPATEVCDFNFFNCL
jgi:Chitin binding Peritrophin-A domain